MNVTDRWLLPRLPPLARRAPGLQRVQSAAGGANLATWQRVWRRSGNAEIDLAPPTRAEERREQRREERRGEDCTDQIKLFLSGFFFLIKVLRCAHLHQLGPPAPPAFVFFYWSSLRRGIRSAFYHLDSSLLTFVLGSPPLPPHHGCVGELQYFPGTPARA